jgi:hypothetical protein
VVGQKTAQAERELFAPDASRVARRGARDKLEVGGPRIAEAADFQHNAPGRFFGHPQHAAHQGLLAAAEMQERGAVLPARLVLSAFEAREPLAIFAHFGRTRRAHTIEGPSQFAGQFHRRELLARKAKRGSHFS